MERPQRERDELRLLQLQMGVVIDAVRRKREDDAGDDRGAVVAGQPAHQERDADPGEREAGKEDEVVDQDRADAQPMQWRGEQARHEQRSRNRPACCARDRRCWRRRCAPARAAAGARPTPSTHVTISGSPGSCTPSVMRRTCGQVITAVSTTNSARVSARKRAVLPRRSGQALRRGAARLPRSGQAPGRSPRRLEDLEQFSERERAPPAPRG